MQPRTSLTLLVSGLGIAAGIQFLPAIGIGGGISANLAVAFGFVIGILSGGLGMGGVWLMVPSMKFLFGIDIKTAIGTALTAQVLITLVGSREHLRKKATGMRIAKPLIIGGVIGTPVGVWLNVRAPDLLLNWIYVVLLAVLAVKMGWELAQDDGAADKTDGRNMARDLAGDDAVETVEENVEDTVEKGLNAVEKTGEKLQEVPAGNKPGDKLKDVADKGKETKDNIDEEIEDDYHGDEYRADTPSLLIAGIGFGLINSLLGTSTTVMVPFLDVFMRLSTHVATAVSLINVTAISIPASFIHVYVGNVMYSLAGAVAAAGIFGAVVGSDLNEKAPDRTIQAIFVILLLAMAYYMLPVKPI